MSCATALGCEERDTIWSISYVYSTFICVPSVKAMRRPVYLLHTPDAVSRGNPPPLFSFRPFCLEAAKPRVFPHLTAFRRRRTSANYHARQRLCTKRVLHEAELVYGLFCFIYFIFIYPILSYLTYSIYLPHQHP